MSRFVPRIFGATREDDMVIRFVADSLQIESPLSYDKVVLQFVRGHHTQDSGAFALKAGRNSATIDHTFDKKSRFFCGRVSGDYQSKVVKIRAVALLNGEEEVLGEGTFDVASYANAVKKEIKVELLDATRTLSIVRGSISVVDSQSAENAGVDFKAVPRVTVKGPSRFTCL